MVWDFLEVRSGTAELIRALREPRGAIPWQHCRGQLAQLRCPAREEDVLPPDRVLLLQ